MFNRVPKLTDAALGAVLYTVAKQICKPSVANGSHSRLAQEEVAELVKYLGQASKPRAKTFSVPSWPDLKRHRF